MLSRLGKCVAVVGLGLGTCGSAMAADDGFYLGFGVGSARPNFDFSGALAASAPAGTTGTIDDSDTGWKVFAGYQFNKYFGAEFNYIDFGKYNFRGATLGIPFTGDVKIDGYGLAAVGTLPLDGGFSLFGKLGAFYSKESATLTAVGVSSTSDDNKWVPHIGIGARYDIDANISVHLEAERFQGMGDNNNTIKTDMNLFTLGLRYKF